MALIRVVAAMMIMIIASSAAAGGIELRQFDDPVMQARYYDLTAAMRCPLCENQAIGDSNAPIAADMRDRVYQLLQEGRSDIEIVDHMVQRFGEYILYNPRLENRTYLLWGLPIALVLLGALVVVLMVRARRNASAKALSAEERQRVEALVNRKRSS
ncbi:cytochrome c-type biogenesis protein [Vreelandella profundi]|uniref:cytochrome c-type biogenesis protein n=1 Tax=Vreelandella profundi TaxID=2852117 RepID=UPI001EEFCB79|nr:cytochrome c-type biogenesis protein [Halomonas profundi]